MDNELAACIFEFNEIGNRFAAISIFMTIWLGPGYCKSPISCAIQVFSYRNFTILIAIIRILVSYLPCCGYTVSNIFIKCAKQYSAIRTVDPSSLGQVCVFR